VADPQDFQAWPDGPAARRAQVLAGGDVRTWLSFREPGASCDFDLFFLPSSQSQLSVSRFYVCDFSPIDNTYGLHFIQRGLDTDWISIETVTLTKDPLSGLRGIRQSDLLEAATFVMNSALLSGSTFVIGERWQVPGFKTAGPVLAVEAATDFRLETLKPDFANRPVLARVHDGTFAALEPAVVDLRQFKSAEAMQAFEDEQIVAEFNERLLDYYVSRPWTREQKSILQLALS